MKRTTNYLRSHFSAQFYSSKFFSFYFIDRVGRIKRKKEKKMRRTHGNGRGTILNWGHQDTLIPIVAEVIYIFKIITILLHSAANRAQFGQIVAFHDNQITVQILNMKRSCVLSWVCKLQSTTVSQSMAGRSRFTLKLIHAIRCCSGCVRPLN